MGSVKKRPDGTWRGRWREYPGGPERSKHFALKEQALRHVNQMENDLARGVYVSPEHGRVALVQMMAEHIERQPWRYNTNHNAAWALEHARSFFGNQPIALVRTSDLQRFVTGLDLEPRSVATVWRFVRQTIREAHLDGLVGRDPCLRVTLPRHDGAELVVPTVDEVALLVDAAPDDFAVAVILGAGLGLRSSEAAGLTVDRIDFLRREVRVDRQWHGKLDRFEPVKYAASNRVVPAGDRVLERLAMHLEHHKAGAAGHVLHAEGRALNSNRMSWRWEQTVTAAGLDFTFHQTRHHYASSLLAEGCSIVAVQRALGHSSAAVTLDTYGHLMPSDTERIRTAIDRSWEAAADQSRTNRHRKGL